METITIPKKEYKKLVSKANAYDKLAKDFFESVVEDSVEKVASDFTKTDLYTQDFINDLKEGLNKSSFSKRKK